MSSNYKTIYDEAVSRGFIERDGITFNLANITSEEYGERNLRLSEEQPCELYVSAGYLEDQICVTVEVKTRENVSYMCGRLEDYSNYNKNGVYYFEKTEKGIGKAGLPEEVEVYVDVYCVTCGFNLEETSTGYKYECTYTVQHENKTGTHVSSSGGTHGGRWRIFLNNLIADNKIYKK